MKAQVFAQSLAVVAGLGLVACSSNSFKGTDREATTENAPGTGTGGGTGTGTPSGATPGAPAAGAPGSGTGTAAGTPVAGAGAGAGAGVGTGNGTGTGTPGSVGTSAQPGPGLGGGGASACNLSGNFVQLQQLPAVIQNCINSGSLFDFSSNSCFADIQQATDYPCTFAGVQQKVQALGQPVQPVLDAEAQGAKLVGCGERRSGQTIVLEWWVPPSGTSNCAFNASMQIGVECYATNTATPVTGAPGTAAGVANCVNAN